MVVINGYTLNTEWTRSANGSFAFCTKDGRDYFIKEMPSPVYPSPGVLPPTSYDRVKRGCDEWFTAKRELIARLQKAAAMSPYIIAPTDIFIHKCHFYIVSPKVDGAIDDHTELFRREVDVKTLLVRFTEALVALHKNNIVHGDLKHSNVFILNTPLGLEPRFIDFDDSYTSTRPPEPGAMIGSPEYYSPEMGRYIVSEDPDIASTITCKSDVFAAGIIFHEYLTGNRPISGRYKYPFQIKRDDEMIVKVKDPELRVLIKSMLIRDNADRPDAESVMKALIGKKVSSEEDKKSVTGSGGVRIIIHSADGKYRAIGYDGASQYIPEFVAKGMNRTKRVPIEEDHSESESKAVDQILHKSMER